MAQTKLENHLSRVSLIRRLVWIVLTILYIATAALLYIGKWDPVTQAFSGEAEMKLFIFAVGMALVFIFLLIYDFLWCRFKVIQREGQMITFYRGFFYRIIYVNGKVRGRLNVIGAHFHDVQLTGKVRMTIVFSNAYWHLGHIYYSDLYPTEII